MERAGVKVRKLLVAIIIAVSVGLFSLAVLVWRADQARLEEKRRVACCALAERNWNEGFSALEVARRAYESVGTVLAKYGKDGMEHQALILLRGKRARDLHETASSLELWPANSALLGGPSEPRIPAPQPKTVLTVEEARL
jgi:hypothetical protein